MTEMMTFTERMEREYKRGYGYKGTGRFTGGFGYGTSHNRLVSFEVK